ncbi:MAG: PorT family protein [Prevotella sp.]|nr:PorT family protein [Prevotella sp.]
MMMKRFLTVLMVSACTIVAHAQYQAGDMFVYPRLGFAVSNLTSNSIYYSLDDNRVESKAKAGLAVGVEVERFVSNPLSLSVGLMYTNQGCKFPDFGKDDKEAKTFWNVEDQKTSLHYLQLPVMANLYVADGLAFKAGVALGYLLKANQYGTENEGVIEEDGLYTIKTSNDLHEDMNDAYRKFDLSIPIGVSYEYMGVVLDLRYHLGLTKVTKIVDKCKTSMLTFTLGYQFEL